MKRLLLILIIPLYCCTSGDRSSRTMENSVYIGLSYQEMIEKTANYPKFKHHFVSYNGSQTIRFESPLLELGVDSVYFMHLSKNKLEILVKTKHSNPIWFIAVDSTGNYTTNYYLGEQIFDLSYSYKKDTIVYDFNIKKPIMMETDYCGNCRISSAINDIGSVVVCHEK